MNGGAVFYIKRVLQSEIMTVYIFYQRTRPFFQSAPSQNSMDSILTNYFYLKEHVVRVESCNKLKGLESSKL